MCLLYLVLVILYFVESIHCETKLCRSYYTNKKAKCVVLGDVWLKNFTAKKSRCSNVMVKYWQVCNKTTINKRSERVRPRRSVIGWIASCFLSSTRSREGQRRSDMTQKIVSLSTISTQYEWPGSERRPAASAVHRSRIAEAKVSAAGASYDGGLLGKISFKLCALHCHFHIN